MIASRERLRVLISAYACEPNRGSEPGIGWNWAVQAAREHEVWVLTWTKFRDAIEAERECGAYPNLHFAYYELPRWLRPSQRLERLHYVLWQLGVLSLARRLHSEAGFDLVHHVTFNTVEGPGFLWSLGSPFIWGPVGGGQVPNPALKRYYGHRWPVELLRAARKRLLSWNPIVRAAVRRAACILAANGDTERLLAALKPKRLVRELEAAVGEDQIASAEPRKLLPGGAPLTVLWAGQLIPRKAPELAVDVFAALKRRDVSARLLIAGDGPLRSRVETRIQALDLGGRVTLLGNLPYAEMAQRYLEADAFLFTSLQDTSGNVVLEAMARGLPVVTLDQHGAGEIVTDECGLKVAVRSERQVIDDLASALQRLASDPEERLRLGGAARRRITESYTWRRKGELIASLYREACRGKGERRRTLAPLAGRR